MQRGQSHSVKEAEKLMVGRSGLFQYWGAGIGLGAVEGGGWIQGPSRRGGKIKGGAYKGKYRWKELKTSEAETAHLTHPRLY